MMTAKEALLGVVSLLMTLACVEGYECDPKYATGMQTREGNFSYFF